MIEAYLASIVEEERRLNAADAVGVPVDRVTVGDLLDLDQTKVAGAAVPANSSAELLSPREGGAATKAPEDDARFFLASDVRSEVLAIYNRAAANLRATKQAANTYAGTGFKHKEGGREGPGGGARTPIDRTRPRPRHVGVRRSLASGSAGMGAPGGRAGGSAAGTSPRQVWYGTNAARA